jgi:hypothetical protein
VGGNGLDGLLRGAATLKSREGQSEGLMAVGGAGGGTSAAGSGTTVLSEAASCGENGANTRGYGAPVRASESRS